MSEVITWRQMAGPNFSGTAAAMDAAGDRLKQGTDLLTQFAGDQTKLFQQQKAKLKADNTARALAEISSFKTVDELNAAAPNLTFDALRGKHGEDIDAGAVAQQAVAQKGIIEQNNLRSIDLANKTRIAEETPLMGQYREAIQAALNKGDVAGAKSIYEEAATKLTDASDLSNPITEHEAAKFEKGLKQTQANQQTTLFNQAQADRKADLDYNSQLAKDFKDFNLGKKDDLTFVPPPTMPINKAFSLFTANKAAAIEQSDLNTEVKASLEREQNFHKGILTKAEEANNIVLENFRNTKPTAHPSVTAFFNTRSPDEKAAINSVTTPAGVITDYLSKAGVAPAGEWLDDTMSHVGIDQAIDEIQVKLGKTKLEDLSPRVIAAAMQGVTKNNDNKISERDVAVIVNRIKEYTAQDAQYKKNQLEENALVKEKKDLLDDLTRTLGKIQTTNFSEAKIKRRNENALTFSALTGEKPTLKSIEASNGKESQKIGELKAEAANLASQLGISDETLQRYFQAGGQP